SGYASLGPWYWAWREPLFDHYLELAVRVEDGNDASASLLALARARAVDSGLGGIKPELDRAALRSWLRSLPRDSAVLAYYIGGNVAWAWIGDHEGVRRTGLPGPAEIRAQASEMREAIQARTWADFEPLAASLGRLLLDPLGGELPRSIFLAVHGPLLGLPFAALALDGAPLAARREVIHLDRFPSSNVARLSVPQPTSVFLAGDPQDWSGEFATRLEPSEEVRAVSARFVGMGLHAVLGVALLQDEFEDPRYQEAELIHLAVPGVIDLSPMRSSGLMLSEEARGAGRQQLGEATIRSTPVDAGLVFLSRTEFRGQGNAMDNRVGLVSAALEAGAGGVIASLWETEPEARAAFVSAFYAHLADSGEPARALALTQRSLMTNHAQPQWAAFCLTTGR
ncbi:MAG: CHAT domain-containing protein, partial [Xanthomonadales bacterium]|nr:CHAT domain-containing protein [Xanthomonadales bacterium]